MQAVWDHLVARLLGADTGPPITEVVPIRIHGHDSSWPPVLVVSVLVVVLGGLIAALVFIRRAREALRAGTARR